MIASQSIFILFSCAILLIEASKLKCKPIICPTCEFHLDGTYTENSMKTLNAGGPSDGSCEIGQKYIYYGADFGLLNDACCCILIAPSEPIDCNRRASCTPDCPDNLGIGKAEKIGDYFKRIGKMQNDAPSNGCCRAGTFKYIIPAIYTGLDHDVCSCVIKNKAFE